MVPVEQAGGAAGAHAGAAVDVLLNGAVPQAGPQYIKAEADPVSGSSASAARGGRRASDRAPGLGVVAAAHKRTAARATDGAVIAAAAAVAMALCPEDSSGGSGGSPGRSQPSHQRRGSFAPALPSVLERETGEDMHAAVGLPR
jgi:hypothetical protein